MKRDAATVEEHPKGSGRYRVRVRSGGKRPVIAKGLIHAEAVEIANAYHVVRHESDVRDGLSLRDFGEAFLQRRERAGVRAIRTDRSRWKKHIAGSTLGQLAVTTLESRDVWQWLDGLADMAYRSQLRLLNLLRVALQDAVRRGLLKANPARDVEVHRAASARSTDDLEGILTPAEQQALMVAVPARERPTVVFALCTGLRQAEQWWLRWEDVQGGHVVVRRSAGGQPTKSGKPREVPLLPAALAALDALPRRSAHVFPALRGSRRAEGKAPRGWAKWVKAAKIGRPVRWHDLRHTCATALLAGWWGRRWSLDEVCKLLGHSSVQVTERYARKLDSTLRDAVTGTSGPILALPDASNHLSRLSDLNRRPVLYESPAQGSGSASLPAPVATQCDHPGDAEFLEWAATLAEHSERAEAFAELAGGSS